MKIEDISIVIEETFDDMKEPSSLNMSSCQISVDFSLNIHDIIVEGILMKCGIDLKKKLNICYNRK